MPGPRARGYIVYLKFNMSQLIKELELVKEILHFLLNNLYSILLTDNLLAVPCSITATTGHLAGKASTINSKRGLVAL
jgi:hypothetical protein